MHQWWVQHACSRTRVARFTRTRRKLTVPLGHVECVVEARHQHVTPLSLHTRWSPAQLLEFCLHQAADASGTRPALCCGPWAPTGGEWVCVGHSHTFHVHGPACGRRSRTLAWYQFDKGATPPPPPSRPLPTGRVSPTQERVDRPCDSRARHAGRAAGEAGDASRPAGVPPSPEFFWFAGRRARRARPPFPLPPPAPRHVLGRNETCENLVP